MDTRKKALATLTTHSERAEIKATRSPRLVLRYLKDSKKKMGLAMWDVLAPKVPGYVYGPDSGLPTFSLEMLKLKGLIK
jgi:hypothetical protein